MNRDPAAPARTGLLVLTLINLFNYLDRFVVPPLLESIKRSELAPSDAQLGLLYSAFIVVYMLTAPIFGPLGDRGSRPRLLALGVAIWSLATALGGLARSIGALLVARATVGVGEAAYGTIAPSLLADYFPARLRGRVFAVFFAAIPIGSALGYVVGGFVDQQFGWRRAFFVAGGPGLLLALAALKLVDPPRGSQDEPPDPGRPGAVPTGRMPGLSAYGTLWRNRPYRLTVCGYAAYTFALGGIAVWMPTFLLRVRGLPQGAATSRFGAIVVATGFLGTFAGGWVGDYLLRYTRQSYLWVSGLATLAAAPLFYTALVAPAPAVFWSATVAAEVLMFASTGPINSVIVNVVAPGMRATAVAASILAIHLLGDVPSPALVGALSDARCLGQAVLILPLAALVAGAIWTYGALTPAAPPA